MTAEEFVALVRGLGRRRVAFRLGLIDDDYTSGRPRVRFDGESTLSARTYAYLAAYTPAAADRVLVALVGHSGVVLGRVV